MASPPEKIRDFDDILEHVGSWNRYQFILLLMSIPFNILISYAVFSPVLVLYVPDHHCSVDAYFNNSDGGNFTKEQLREWFIPLEGGSLSKCRMYNRSLPTSEDNLFIQEALDSLKTIPCIDGWTYNLTGLFTSAVTEFDWVCEDDWKGPFTQSVAYFGAVFGGFIFGFISDYYGRYTAIVASTTLLLATGVATPFCPDFYSFTILRFAMGMTFYSFCFLFHVLVMESVTPRWRSLVVNGGFAIGATFGGVVEPWMLRELQDWKIFHVVLFAQASIVFITPFFVHESVRWLAERGESKKCVKLLKKIAKTNGKDVKQEVYDSYEKLVDEQYEAAKGAPVPKLTDAFKTPRLRQTMLLVAFVYPMDMLVFDGHVRNIVNLNYDIYSTFTISTAIELPASFAALFACDYLGRRWTAFGSSIAAAISMFLCSFALETPVVLVVISMVGRFLVIIAGNTTLQMGMEVVPTVIRGQSNSILTTFGNLLTLASSYIAHSGTVYPALPFYILSALGAAVALAALGLPETANEKLPNSLEEGEQFGRDQSFFLVPFMAKRHNQRKTATDEKEKQFNGSTLTMDTNVS